MGGGGKGAANTATQNLQNNSTALQGLAQTASGQSTQLFNSAFPGFSSAETFYQNLASGDPGKIAQAISPATQQIGQATAGAKQNILNNDPSGGEKNLALEQANVNQGAQVGNVASQGYLNSFNALSQLAGQGISQGTGLANTATSGYGASNAGNQAAGQLGIQQKGATLGALGGLGSDAASLVGSTSGGSAKGGASGLAALFA